MVLRVVHGHAQDPAAAGPGEALEQRADPFLGIRTELAGRRRIHELEAGKRIPEPVTGARVEDQAAVPVGEGAMAAVLGLDPYDALLDQYEPGGRAARLDVMFADLAAFLPDFLADVMARQAAQTVSTIFW